MPGTNCQTGQGDDVRDEAETLGAGCQTEGVVPLASRWHRQLTCPESAAVGIMDLVGLDVRSMTTRPSGPKVL